MGLSLFNPFSSNSETKNTNLSESVGASAGVQDTEASNILSLGKTGGDISITLTDHDVIRQGLDLIEGGAERNAQVLGQGVTKVLDTQAETNNIIAAAAKYVVDKVTGESDKNRYFLGQAFGEVQANADAAIAAAKQSEKNTIDFATSESEKNRYFLGETTTTALDAVSNALASVLGFNSSESDRNRQFLGQGTQAIYDTIAGESDANRLFLGDFTSAALGNVSGTVQAVQDVAAGSANTLAGGFDNFLTHLTATLDQNYSLVGGSQQLLAENQANSLGGLVEFAKDFLTSSDTRNNENVKVLSDAARTDAAKALDKIIYLAGGTMALFALVTYLRR